MSDEKQFVPAILDREITSPDADAFGHRHFAILMQGLIESSHNEPPFSIGLLGRWGSGKSSIKSLYLTSLGDDASSSSDRRARSKRIHPITFNAWRFGGEGIKRALLRQVYLELGGDKNKLDEALFKHMQRSEPEKRTWKTVLRDGIEQWGGSAVQAVFVLACFLGLIVVVGKVLDLKDDKVLGGLIAASVVVAGAVIKFVLDTPRTPTRYATITQVDAPRSTAEQYEDLLIEQLLAFKSNNRACERIVIFVDDLDRLSPEEMIGGLDAVRTFMEIPKKQIPGGLGVVFVISCDEDRIADALADKHRRSSNPELPGAVFTQADAHRFLDRIFQFRLEIPPFPKRDMRNYAESALLQALPDLRNELAGVAVPLETLIDRMIHVGVATPRNALQIVNAFVQSWWIAKRRERDGAGTDSPGGLQEGAVTKHPLALGAVCALRVDFPDFFRELQREPELIKQFTDVFIRGADLASQPESVQHILRRYLPDGGGGTATGIRTEYRGLRQYIASLQGLRWPKAMRPLLFFSQDPVSRKYGDKALALFEAFVSGDQAGVLVQLGREHDAKKLSEVDVRLLSDLVEELGSETEVRRNNAAAVLAGLGNRYPDEVAHLLLTPLAQRLVESPELRWRLGVANIGHALGPISPSDRQAVASCLVDDFLKTEGTIEFRLETDEPPSLDEAMQMVRQACSIILNVQKNDGLDERHRNVLLDWLESRRVALPGGREQSLSFGHFESWISEHESWLLPALGGRYTALIVEELEKDGTTELELQSVIRRCRLVFDTLYSSGEDSRTELWRQLDRFVAIKEPAIVVLVTDFVGQHANAADESALSAFAAAFANRLHREFGASTGLDLKERSKKLVEIVAMRQGDFQPSCEQPLAGLLANWSQKSDMALLAADLLTPFLATFPNSGASVINDWIGRLLTNLPDPCIDWLAGSFASLLSDQMRQGIVGQLEKVVRPDDATEQELRQYRQFITGLSGSGLATGPMHQHLQKLFETLRTLFGIPEGPAQGNPQQRQQQVQQRKQKIEARRVYLRRTFGAVPRQLEYADKPAGGAMLNELFAATKDDAGLFGWLHSQMADHWPKPTDGSPEYDAERVFANALELAPSVPDDTVMGPLRTMTTLVERHFVADARAKDVVNTACRLWHRTSQQAIESLNRISVVPDPELLAAMIDQAAPESSEAVASLTEGWTTVARRMDFDGRAATSIQVLSKPAKGTQSEPDMFLRLWLNAREDDREQLLKALIVASGLNDDQRSRVWLQIELSEVSDGEFLFQLVPSVVGLGDNPKTVSGVLDFQKEITAKAKNEDERFTLGKQLVKAFRVSSSQEGKNRLAAWLKTLNVEAVLQELTKYGALSEDETAILETHFAKSRQWKKVKGG